LSKADAGYIFQQVIVKATLGRRAEAINSRYYHQADNASSPFPLDLYAADVLQLNANFSLPQVSLLSDVDIKG